MENLPNLIHIKHLQIKGETDPAKKSKLYRELRILEYKKEIEDLKARITHLRELNKKNYLQ